MPHNLAIQMEGPDQAITGDELPWVRCEATGMEGEGWGYTWHIRDAEGEPVGRFTDEGKEKKVVVWQAPEQPGPFRVEVVARRDDNEHHDALFLVRRSEIIDTPDLPLWSVIRASTDRLA